LVTLSAGAGHVAMDIRNPVASHEPEGGMPLEERDHMRPGLKECIDLGRVVAIAEFVPQIGSG
jgi:hypothetical protein